ncbi:hypothetical protein FJR38_25980 [Anabaena sp. UHCC 0253]|uniref:hypothetical protein n=1 Tax=Anabaena sp. UHCC 0253 TaxID=2590019 RepID=UPI001446C71C|nr:hypothetical protein [Anabaena sp. UHCC 0253]MTJ55865.1 hypothetical protein [Anabaena sp. UHCC 0253]
MDIYVQSRGFYQDDDYHWLEITAASQQSPEKLPYILQRSTDLIESESPSVVIARNGQWLTDLYRKDAVKSIRKKGIDLQSVKVVNNLRQIDFQKVTLQNSGKLCLLITGLKPNGRTDFLGRQIRISFACICEDSDDNERCLRWLAARLLEEKAQILLTEEISQVITLGGEEGFQVNCQALLNLIEKGKSENLPNAQSPDEDDIKIGSNPDLKAQLADDLKQYRLPKRETPLVVCTDIKAEKILIEAQVWRGISSLVKANGWKYINKKEISAFSKKDLEEWLLTVALSSGNIVILFLIIFFFASMIVKKCIY